MLVAGALCGLCLGWSFGILFTTPSRWNWILYNLVYVAMFGVLGGVSVAMFDPIKTVEILIEANESPNELIRKALPLTIIFTVLSAAAVTLVFRRRWASLGPVLITTVVLVLTLGLNVSIIGLVALPSGSFYLVIELFALILALGIAFAVSFIALERNQLRGQTIGNSVDLGPEARSAIARINRNGGR